MENPVLQKPCLVQTAQGFSVSYNNKLLYSKYSPQKAILQNIQNLNLLPGSLILCMSPVLPYGLKELLKKLPENCFLLCCEIDDNLRSFINEIKTDSDFLSDYKEIAASKKVALLEKKEILNLPEILNKSAYTFADGAIFPKAGTFKRVISIDFSAGVQFQQDFYNKLNSACTNAIMTFWSNRVTLVKFGRNYSSNFFKNLKQLPESKPITNYFSNIHKAIIVFGAGQSIDKGIREIKNKADQYYILCTDTSFNSLLQNDIIPDGVFIEEAQQVILKAFIGTRNLIKQKTQIFAGLSSLPLLAQNFPINHISYFTTKYDDTSFFKSKALNSVLPPENPPFGSVGLTTVYYALKFRKNDSIPVFIYGLDFSYSSGLTHGKGTMAHTTRLLGNNRLNPLNNYRAAYINANAFLDKNHQIFYTTHILSSYAHIFNHYFADIKNLYDSGDSGIPLSIPKMKPYVVESSLKNSTDGYSYNSDFSNQISRYFNEEKNNLNKVRDILSGKIQLEEKERNKIIEEIIKPREYLYLHFPDGWNFSTDISFLKRIRAELDFFLKIF